MTDLSPETVGKLVVIARRLHDAHLSEDIHGENVCEIGRLADAVIYDLPVDPDLAEARTLAADACEALGHTWVKPIRNGEKDEDARSGVGLALAAIKRGRALERGEAR